MAVLSPPVAPASGKTKATAAAVQANPFSKASDRKTESFDDRSYTLGASSTSPQQVNVPATGYLRHIVVDVDVSGVVGATYVDDAPWSIFSEIKLTDVNGQAIVQLEGFDLFLANLLGGYTQHADPRLNVNYKSTATGFHLQVRLPVEIVQRNALGSLVNMNAAMTYKVKYVLAPAAEVFAAGSPDNIVRVQLLAESWASPAPVDVHGVPNTPAPPALGTTQNWSEYVAPVVVGKNTIRLPRVGNTIRNLVFIYRDVAGDRQVVPVTDIGKYIDGNQWTNNPFSYELQRLGELYGFAAADIPAGVWMACQTDDFDGTPGEEIGDYWLPTSGATRLELQFVSSAAGSLTVLTNDILAYSANGGTGQTLGS